MALPQPQTDPPSESGERILRTVRGEDGHLRILELPPTLENLLDPRLEDQLTQSNDHVLTLVPLFDALKRHLKRLAPGLAVFSDLMLLYKRHGYRDVSPDVAVVEGLPHPEHVTDSLDVIAEGGRLRLVIEVVSTSTADMRKKDEEANPELFAELGVEDYVLIYPGRSGRPPEVVAHRLAAPGRYRPNLPDSRRRVLLRSAGLWLWVDRDENRLVMEHRETGERLLTSEEEEARRRAAERRAEEAGVKARAETLIELLDARGLEIAEDDRRRILGCRDVERLKSWTRRALTAGEVHELWDD